MLYQVILLNFHPCGCTLTHHVHNGFPTSWSLVADITELWLQILYCNRISTMSATEIRNSCRTVGFVHGYTNSLQVQINIFCNFSQSFNSWNFSPEFCMQFLSSHLFTGEGVFCPLLKTVTQCGTFNGVSIDIIYYYVTWTDNRGTVPEANTQRQEGKYPI